MCIGKLYRLTRRHLRHVIFGCALFAVIWVFNKGCCLNEQNIFRGLYSDGPFGYTDLKLNDSILNSSGIFKPQALIIVTEKLRSCQAITEIWASLNLLRMEYETRFPNESMADLKRYRLYNAVIFISMRSYAEMNKTNKDLINHYSKTANIGVFIVHWSLAPKGNFSDTLQVSSYLLSNVTSYRINPNSTLWRITKDGGYITDDLESGMYPWAAFNFTGHQNSSFKPLAYMEQGGKNDHVVAFMDTGEFDGMKKIVLGNTLSFWLHHSIFLDALYYLSGGWISRPLQRTMIVDIDDVFMGKVARMKESDVKALLDTQRKLRKLVTNFTFNLGFCGNYFKKATAERIKGDLLFMELKDEFLWFPHTFNHITTQYAEDISVLETDMVQNREFANRYKLPLVPHYAVSPRHSGIYPILEILYQAWKRIWDIRVTSTVLYWYISVYGHMHYGFQHSGIQVLPRETLILSSKYTNWTNIPGKRAGLIKLIKGKDIYIKFLYNTLNLIVTHSYNYANDRVANTILEESMLFMNNWTHLDFVTKEPVQAAQEYFADYAKERRITWQNPCQKTLIASYPNAKRCQGYRYPLPDFVILGPPKTGTAALQMFLKLHPDLLTSFPDTQFFEEVQFFNSEYAYIKGVDWYMNRFPNKTSPHTLLFEKSAPYFSFRRVTPRFFSLLPHAKLIIMLGDPVARAYSYYQHMQAHKYASLMNISFYDVITNNLPDTKVFQDLHRAVIDPGLYAIHIRRWLTYYPLKKMLFIDADRLRFDPVAVLNDVQAFINVNRKIDYSNLLRFVSKKGFFCHVDPKRRSPFCLGEGKGRSKFYKPMTAHEKLYLERYYRKPNHDLKSLLLQLGIPVPNWLTNFVQKHPR